MTAITNPKTWLKCTKPNSHVRLRLFCFPSAGGGASLFRSWSDGLPQDIEVYPVQLPGRENRLLEPAFSRILPMVQVLADIMSSYLSIPFAFFGHSMGALISFELARQVRRKSHLNPIYLFVSGCRAPQILYTDPPIHHLPDSAFIEELHRLNGTPSEVLENAELMHLLMPTLRADFALYETYTYSPEKPLDCPVSAFGGLQDSTVIYDNLAAWHKETHGGFKLRELPGDHFFLRSSRAPLLQSISQDLSDILKPKVLNQVL